VPDDENLAVAAALIPSPSAHSVVVRTISTIEDSVHTLTSVTSSPSHFQATEVKVLVDFCECVVLLGNLLAALFRSIYCKGLGTGTTP
jgi:hypothetical protein